MTILRTWLMGLAILAAASLAGCMPLDPAPKDKDKNKTAKDKGGHDHDHGEVGPHGGPLADWSDIYHAEFTVDHKKKEARVYILDEKAKLSKPIRTDKVRLVMKKPKFDIELKPERQKDDPEGTASVFVGTHDELAKERDFEGNLSALIEGKPFAADFRGHGHSHK